MSITQTDPNIYVFALSMTIADLTGNNRNMANEVTDAQIDRRKEWQKYKAGYRVACYH